MKSYVQCNTCGSIEEKKNHEMKKAFFNPVWVCSSDCHIEYEIRCRSYSDRGVLSQQQLNDIFRYWE